MNRDEFFIALGGTAVTVCLTSFIVVLQFGEKAGIAFSYALLTLGIVTGFLGLGLYALTLLSIARRSREMQKWERDTREARLKRTQEQIEREKTFNETQKQLVSELEALRQFLGGGSKKDDTGKSN